MPAGPVIRVAGFLGANRAINPRLLAEGIGVTSLNQKPGRGDLRPWRAPLAVASVPAGRKTIYRMGRDVADAGRYWLSWTTTVHAVRGFDAGDTTERTYYTGDGAPKVTNNIVALNSGGWVNGDALPKSSRPLGLPRPTSAPTVTVIPAPPDPDLGKGVTTIADSQIAALTAGNQLRLVLGTDTAGAQTITVAATTRSAIAEQMNALNGVAATAEDGSTDGRPAGVRVITDGNVTTFTIDWRSGSTGTWTLIAASATVSADTTDTQTVYYVYTYVNDWGWESQPSPVSTKSTRAQDETATIGGFVAPPAGNYNINRIRLYRTQTGASGATEFYFLREISSETTVVATALVRGNSYRIKTLGDTDWTAVGAPSNAVDVEFTASGVGTGTGTAVAFGLTVADTIDDNRGLNDLLATTKWAPPPDTLRNLTALWDGMMAGIAGNSVRICEPYAHYAWPTSYELVPPDSTPVALGVIGQMLLVLTTGRPLQVAGSTPESMDQQPLPFVQSCVSARSAVSMGGGVAWASDDGLCWYDGSAPRVLTAGVMLREDWQALVPSSIVGFQYEGMYFGSYDDGGGRKGFLLDPRNPNSGIYFLSAGYETAYFDDYADAMFVLDGVNVKKWDAGANFLTATFRSKVYRLERPVSFSCAKVVADAYPVTVKVLAADAGGAMVERLSRSVSSQAPFRLPTGFRSTDWQVEVVCSSAVLGAALATSMDDLAEV